ncbi:class II aldolase/adducin family protein [Streptomyces sp. SID8361]|uniref:class II aldolase/adducin family protein n=1 Tax=Streptomyces sp. MnatMP-M27 TaxID=1839768 RepID=UPI00081EF6D0|nr:class II aldolase/adducin family protein [Streptomyces sp. MnatMP-M27]MYU11416.1 class II aldolase/adducin family protein [Streptomyces sp. SID8361]SCF81296.1 3,4-dihydroxyphthalate decarboxylase [Streptomyces sp. MnatMP-M27]
MTSAPAPRELIALGCRILAFRGLAADILGHISLRRDDGALYLRCRGPHERGLLLTEPSDVHPVPLDGEPAPPDGYRVPNELPIHREILRTRPDVAAVVHVHPPHVVAADLAGLPLRPIVGAYDIPAMRMALDGIPVYPRAVLVTRADLGQEVAEALADRPVAILRGHGIVATGDSVQQAVVRALSVESLAMMTLRSAAGPALPPPLPPEDIAELPDLGGGFNDTLVWNSHVAALEHAGLGL